jgi:hypothetical protein
MTERVQPVPGMPWKSIDVIVTRFIDNFYPELLNNPGEFPVQEFLELKLSKIGYDYEIAELPHGKEAETDFQEKVIRISVSTYEALCRNEGRARFTVMHEIGHAILHDKYFRGIIRKERPNIILNRKKIPAYKDPECQANVFASSALMPTKFIKGMCLRGTDEYEIAAMFAVSYSTALYRIKNLDKF